MYVCMHFFTLLSYSSCSESLALVPGPQHFIYFPIKRAWWLQLFKEQVNEGHGQPGQAQSGHKVRCTSQRSSPI